MTGDVLIFYSCIAFIILHNPHIAYTKKFSSQTFFLFNKYFILSYFIDVVFTNYKLYHRYIYMERCEYESLPKSHPTYGAKRISYIRATTNATYESGVKAAEINDAFYFLQLDGLF